MQQRIVKYNYGLYDPDKHTGFINIFDENFYVCTRWRDGELIEVIDLPEDSTEYFLTWYDKLKRWDYAPKWNVDLIKDFWQHKDGGILWLEDIGIEIMQSGDRIRQVDGDWFDVPHRVKVENFKNLSLLGI
ncbi:MAG: hypothetical protein PUP93_26840 [Rhizonema sp. NSF051]|nr:hypothetical protein [Rhizonema sp. NSF051]